MVSMPTERKVDLKITILGTLGTGKTSLLNQYVHKRFRNDYLSTLGAFILSKTINVENTTLKLQIWDTGGQERFRSLVSSFYKGSDGCLLVFDVTDEESFANLDFWIREFIDNIYTPGGNIPVIILGNKIDLQRKVSKERADNWCKDREMLYLEASAKDNINVEVAFETLAKKALFYYRECKESLLIDSIKLTPKEDTYKNGCC